MRQRRRRRRTLLLPKVRVKDTLSGRVACYFSDWQFSVVLLGCGKHTLTRREHSNTASLDNRKDEQNKLVIKLSGYSSQSPPRARLYLLVCLGASWLVTCGLIKLRLRESPVMALQPELSGEQLVTGIQVCKLSLTSASSSAIVFSVKLPLSSLASSSSSSSSASRKSTGWISYRYRPPS